MQNINEMKDREILELLLTNQISLAQQIHRIREVLANKFPKEYSNCHISKLNTFEGLIENSDDFLREFAASKS
jgi:hypothetical protein